MLYSGPQPQRKPKRLGRRTGGIVAGLVAVMVALGSWNYFRPLPGIPAAVEQVAAVESNLRPIEWPDQGQAAVGAKDFGVLATQGTQTPQPIASIAKVITSLAVLERLPLKSGQPGKQFTVTPADVALYEHYISVDGSTAKVTAGEQLSEYQALQAVLLPSANNVADSLATWVFGSMDAYHTYANDMVKRLGMKNTSVGGDASGLSPATASTAADLVILGEAAMKQPVLAEIVGQSTAVLPMAGTVHNVDWLLGQEGVVGIKTGNTDEAGGCFLGAATHRLADGSTMTVISAILGATHRDVALSQTVPLLQSLKANFGLATPVVEGQVLGSYNLPWGRTVQAVAAKDLSLPAWSGNRVTTAVSLDELKLPRSTESVGRAAATAGDQSASIEATLDRAVPEPSFWWRLTRW